ncbi:MAG: glycoside hydrolase N-terminal domain-containing protein [Micromonosporaceae bacterium]|nr:glycoside hydrolase N-terminal domain-containing protein [Micromonosporaceae bacterium]
MKELGFWSAIATDDWEQALISGNGRQGALCYGGPGGVRITLSHERLFLPVDEPLAAPQTARILPKLREAVLGGRYQEAADAVVAFASTQASGFQRLRRIDPLIGAATLTLHDLPGPVDGYRRGVDFGTGVVTQAWAGARVELFVSRAHDVVAIRITAAGRAMQLRVRLGQIDDTPPVPVDVATTAVPDGLLLTGAFPTAWPAALRGYAVACRVLVPDGVSRPERNGALSIDGTGEVLLLLRTVVGEDAASTLHDLRALPVCFRDLLDAHRRCHEPLMRRCRLWLGTAADQRSSEELLARPDDPGLVERLFDAGRYAIISSTGDLPPTLQGVWSGSYHPAWQSGYTLDGNLFAALAALAPTGTPELLLPFFNLMDLHLGDFRENARRLYGAPGILLPAHLSTHGRHNHFDRTWCLTFWTAGAAWAARVYEEYWTHTGDEEFWRCRALPFLHAAAAFYTAFAPDGVFAPSYSPENAPANTGSQAAVNAAMDIATVRALLRMLGERTDHLPRHRPAEDGTLAEWLWPGLFPNHAHRHASHLYPLWYAPDPALREDPVLRAAAERTVLARLAWWRAGDPGPLAGPGYAGVAAGEMAFGLVQLGLAAAALGMAETCHEILTLLAGGYWRPNLVSTHNKGRLFNVDICGGLPALVAAMLLGSAPGRLDVLPALPRAWTQGEIQGLLARGGVAVDRLAWSPEGVELALRAGTDTTIALRPPRRYGDTRELDLPAGKVVDVRLFSRKN